MWSVVLISSPPAESVAGSLPTREEYLRLFGKAPPKLTATIVRPSCTTSGTAYNGTASVAFTATFSEAVTGVTAADFVVDRGLGIGGVVPVVAGVTGSGTTWTVTVVVSGWVESMVTMAAIWVRSGRSGSLQQWARMRPGRS